MGRDIGIYGRGSLRSVATSCRGRFSTARVWTFVEDICLGRSLDGLGATAQWVMWSRTVTPTTRGYVLISRVSGSSKEHSEGAAESSERSWNLEPSSPAAEVTRCKWKNREEIPLLFSSCLLIFFSCFSLIGPSEKWAGASLVVQWLRLDGANTGGPGSIPGQETRSPMLQQRAHILQLQKDPKCWWMAKPIQYCKVISL